MSGPAASRPQLCRPAAPAAPAASFRRDRFTSGSRSVEFRVEIGSKRPPGATAPREMKGNRKRGPRLLESITQESIRPSRRRRHFPTSATAQAPSSRIPRDRADPAAAPAPNRSCGQGLVSPSSIDHDLYWMEKRDPVRSCGSAPVQPRGRRDPEGSCSKGPARSPTSGSVCAVETGGWTPG